MDSAEVLSHYHGLWQVEETFRISKYDLRVRPIYHWTPARVARTHRDFVHGADVCATSGLSSPDAVQAAVARSGAQCTVACSVRYCERSAQRSQRYAIPMQLSQVAKKLYWMMELERSSVPFEID